MENRVIQDNIMVSDLQAFLSYLLSVKYQLYYDTLVFVCLRVWFHVSTKLADKRENIDRQIRTGQTRFGVKELRRNFFGCSVILPSPTNT